MVCLQCGTELPPEARFCWNCGQTQVPGLMPDAALWSTCEIVYTTEIAVLITSRFWARAVGPAGEFNAGESEAWVGAYPDSARPVIHAAHAALVRRLVADGWQHVGRGFLWYNDWFRRWDHGRNRAGGRAMPAEDDVKVAEHRAARCRRASQHRPTAALGSTVPSGTA